MLISLIAVFGAVLVVNLVRRTTGGRVTAHHEGAGAVEPLQPQMRLRKTRGLLRIAAWIVRLMAKTARLIARHRITLCPLLAGGFVWLAGQAVDVTRPAWWIAAACSSAAAWGAAIAAGRSESVPQWLAAYPSLVAAGWVTACSIWSPNLIAWGAGCAAFALAWWIHPDIRGLIWFNIRLQYWLAWWPHAMRGLGLGGVAVRRVARDDPRGKRTIWRIKVPPKQGLTIESLRGRVHEMESALGWPRGVIKDIELAPNGDSSQGDLIRQEVSRLAMSSTLPEEGRPQSIYDPFMVGPNEDGEIVTVRLADRKRGIRHVLLGGKTDEGKSTQEAGYGVQLAGCDDVALVLIDLKGGLEARNLAPRAARIARTPEEATVLLEGLAAMVPGTMPLIPAGHNVMVADESNPAIVVIIDELSLLTSEEAGNPRAVAALHILVTQGRAMMIGLIMATNSPSASAIRKGEIRGNPDIVHVFAGNRSIWRNIIGKEALKRVHQSELTGAGRQYVMDGLGSRPVLVRGCNATPAMALKAGKSLAYLAPEIHPVRANAAGPSWATAWGRTPDDLLPFLSPEQLHEVYRLRAEQPSPPPEEPDQVVVPMGSGNDRQRRAALAGSVTCRALAEAGPDGASPADIVSRPGAGSRATVNRHLAALVDAGSVERCGFGKYRVVDQSATANDLGRVLADSVAVHAR